ncbi:beta-galactosidase [candidate division KSB1 bacterium]|nr:beta-galactosidase [candidate division KSB1 bacterium]RQW05416.1 MAG: beta-galactosidase [candidate division KSB1 bacterium]
MKVVQTVFVVLLLIFVTCTRRPWQRFNNPSMEELAANFQKPPVEYSMTFYWGWDGKITEEVIARDLDAFKERGVHIVTLESGYDMGHPYLSQGWFDLVKKTVELARERDMRVWIVDEGKYPSGFAGGKFTTDAPDLRMKALVVAERMDLAGGDTLVRQIPQDVISAIAINQLDSTNLILDVRAGELQWTAPEGQWEVVFIKHDFRSSPTRAVNNPTRGKDPSNSLCDYLDPAATRQFIEFTHAQHKAVVGSEFGKTVLGFRGDEPDYSIRGIPWTPQLFATFESVKGYDVRPYIAAFFSPRLTDEQQRVKADYWDVWSNLFGANFFQIQADWCAEHNVEYLVHLNHEDKMVDLIRSEGDFFENMRHVQMPGVDAIWDQIWPGKVSDYPKYASSVSHVYGKPRTFTESFAAYRPAPTLEQAKWILDCQFARGINMVEVMFVPASTRGELGLHGWTASEEFASVAKYVHRACYLLSQGRPVAHIAVFHPTFSIWLGFNESNEYTLHLMQQLLEHQRDFDFVDEHALSSQLILEDGALKSRSDQSYRTVLVPSAMAMSNQALDQLRTFAASGGQVVFLGQTPSLVIESTFRDATGPADVSWAIHEPSGELTPRVMAALPQPDVKLDVPAPVVKYLHRRLADADLYFFFNESTESQSCNAVLQGNGAAQEWDAMSGELRNIDGELAKEGFAKIKLNLEAYQTKFIMVRPVNQ